MDINTERSTLQNLYAIINPEKEDFRAGESRTNCGIYIQPNNEGLCNLPT